MDVLSLLGFTGGPTIPGATPDQQAQYNQLQNQAMGRAIIPALIAGTVGALTNRHYQGDPSNLAVGLRDAARGFIGSQRNTMNQALQESQLLARQRQQALLGQLAARRQQDQDINTALHGQTVQMQQQHNAPVGVDWAAPFRSKGLVVPDSNTAASMSRSEVDQWLGSHVPAQLHQQVMEGIANQRVGIANQQLGIANRRLGIEQQKVAPVGYDPFTMARQNPALAAILPSPGQAAQLNQNQVAEWQRTMLQYLAPKPKAPADLTKEKAATWEQAYKTAQAQYLQSHFRWWRPSAADVDSYAHQQADEAVGRLYGNPKGANRLMGRYLTPDGGSETGSPNPSPNSTSNSLPAGAIGATNKADGVYHKDGKTLVVRSGYIYQE